MKTIPETLRDAHRHTLHNRLEIEASQLCGCCACMTIYPAADIVVWADGGVTAICPLCGTDAVIGDAAPPALTTGLLADLNRLYF